MSIKSKILAFSTILIGVVMFAAYAINNIRLNQDCVGFMKRAADANSIEIAEKELNKVINYLEVNNLTSGYTSVFYKTPDEDIEFFYTNLKACQKELSDVKDSPNQMDTTNTLMKLRETLTDNDKNGTTLTYPDGLSRHPNNLLWGIGMILGAISFCFGIILCRLDL